MHAGSIRAGEPRSSVLVSEGGAVAAPARRSSRGARGPSENLHCPLPCNDFKIRDRALEPVREKVLAGRRLSFEDGVALYRSHDLLAVGALANHVREERHGDAAYFVWNTHINHTNVCVATCDFCAFAAKKDEPRAYTMSLDDVFANVAAPAQGRCARCTSWAGSTPTCPSRTSRT